MQARVSARPLTVTQKNRPKHNMISAGAFVRNNFIRKAFGYVSERGEHNGKTGNQTGKNVC